MTSATSTARHLHLVGAGGRLPRTVRALVTIALGGALLAPVPVTAQTAVAPAPASAREIDSERSLFPDPPALERGIQAATRLAANADGGEVKSGLYAVIGHMPTGAGWISAGPGYRHWWFGDAALVDLAAAVSWRGYKMAEASVELPRLAGGRIAIGTRGRWHDLTQVDYFGTGPDTSSANRSEYRLRVGNVGGYASYLPWRHVAVDGQFGWVTRPDIAAPTGPFQRTTVDTRTLFPGEAAFVSEREPTFIHAAAALTLDSRNHRSYPTRGTLYRAAWERYADRTAG